MVLILSATGPLYGVSAENSIDILYRKNRISFDWAGQIEAKDKIGELGKYSQRTRIISGASDNPINEKSRSRKLPRPALNAEKPRNTEAFDTITSLSEIPPLLQIGIVRSPDAPEWQI